MGNLMDSFCCIDTNEILENTNFRKFSSSNNKENREDSYSGMATPSSELKSLPIMEMKTDNFITPKAKIKSLSNLPISTKNVIRKISGDPFDNYRIIKKLGQGTFGQGIRRKSRRKTRKRWKHSRMTENRQYQSVKNNSKK